MNGLARVLVDSVYHVRQELGAGLVESVYVACLVDELKARGIEARTSVRVPVTYKGRTLEKHFEVDVLVGGQVVVEAKAVEALHPMRFAQLLTYLRLAGKPLGFLVNFNAVPLESGIHRRINSRIPSSSRLRVFAGSVAGR